MPALDLRPLGFGELLDRSFSYYRRRFWTFVGIMVVPQFFLIVATLAIASALRAVPAHLSLVVLRLLVSMGIMLAYLLPYTLAYAATTFAVSEIHLGRAIAIGAAYRRAQQQLGRLLKLFGLALLYALGWAATLILSPVVVLMFFWYAFAVPVLLLEGLGTRQSLKRSRQMTRGQLDRIFLVWLLTVIVSVVLSIVIQGPFYVVSMVLLAKHSTPPYWLEVASTIAGGISGALAGPLFLIALVLLYYDVRVRKEGYDLQVMLEALPNASA
jgi:hypothetical protein